MRFRVESLGPLREAEVDLTKNLIIFAGPNNTGKTYLAWAIYGFERFELTEELPSLTPILDALLANPDEPVSLADVLDRGDFIKDLTDQFSKNIADEFSGNPMHFAGTRVSVTRLHWRGSVQRVVTDGFVITLQFLDDPIVRLSVSRMDEDPGDTGTQPVRIATLDVDTRNRLRGATSFALKFGLRIALRSRNATTVFPVERLAINTFVKELTERRHRFVDRLRVVADRGRQVDLEEAISQHVERYPRAIRDALQDATRLDRYRRRTGPLADLADELEATVLGGRVALNEDDVLEFTPTRAAGTHLRIQQSASVVKSLASLVFHLRHRATPDERLIIDEPELNLHPDNQRKVARVLAKLVNRGLQLIISTHSDYLVRELNNLIMLSRPSDAARDLTRDLGLHPDMLLTPDQLGVYLFRPDGTCTPVPVTDTGFEVQTIDDEVHRLNLESQTIYSRLFLDE